MVVSFLGTLGLAMSLLYLIATVLNFVTGFSQLSRFMIGNEEGLSYGFTLLIVPCLLMIAHLYFRSVLANWLFNRGDFDLAREFVEKRQSHNLLRSKAESLANRSIFLALLIHDRNWEEAIKHFESTKPQKKNPFFWRWVGWGAELYWRLDQFEKLDSLFAKNGTVGKLGERYDAIRAHYYFEKGDKVEAESILKNQSWNAVPSRVLMVSSIVHDLDLDRSAWDLYVSRIPSAYNELSLLASSPLELGGDDPRTVRLIGAGLDSEE